MITVNVSKNKFINKVIPPYTFIFLSIKKSREKFKNEGILLRKVLFEIASYSAILIGNGAVANEGSILTLQCQVVTKRSHILKQTCNCLFCYHQALKGYSHIRSHSQCFLCFLPCVTGHEENLWNTASITFSHQQTFFN